MSSCSPEACIHRVTATFNSPIKAAEHVSFVKRYLNPNLFQVSLLLEAKTLAALSLGKRKVRWKKGRIYIYIYIKNVTSFCISLKTFPGSRFPSSRRWKQSCVWFSGSFLFFNFDHSCTELHVTSSLILNAWRNQKKRTRKKTCHFFPHNKMFWHWTVAWTSPDSYPFVLADENSACSLGRRY